ncbi:MAG: HAMP domain-containing protein [Myxococcales bacterium]|nr:HAMP domain-containing protein [Myxococcales bacterium]
MRPGLDSEGRISLTADERRRRRRDWGIAGLVALLLLGLVGLEKQLLSFSQTLPIGSDAVFLTLVHINVIGIAILVFLLGRNVVKLVVERRRGIMGSRLNTKFVVSFVFVAAVSTTALFIFSAFLVIHTIDVWFKLQLSDSLGESVEVANTYYREAEDQALYFARLIASQVEERRLLRQDGLEDLAYFIAHKQLEYNLGVVEVFSAQLEELAKAIHPDVPVVALEARDSELIRTGLSGIEQTSIQDAGAGELIRGVVPVHSTFQEREVVGVVVVNRYIPRAMGRRVDVIRAAAAAYERLKPSEGTFQTSMLLLLAMITLLSLLFSSWMGFRLSKQITVPIQNLAAATAEVAAGNLDVRIEHPADDEIGLLVAAFNRMATDLSVGREDLERRRAQMEIILGSVAAGVVSLDKEAVVTTINPSAQRLLGIARGAWVGKKVSEVLESSALETAEDLLRRVASGPQEALRRQVSITVGDEVRTLNWTVSRLRDAEGESAGFVLVLDDVTQILNVQRMAAWREVARRIAHEIKNPLTPIQLSAQRLRRKLGERVSDPADRKLLNECTDAITNQVQALKLLVSEFSNFAQLPATDPTPTDLNQLVRETVTMYRGKPGIEFETQLAPSLPKLDLDCEQIKRVILNLVDNAMGAIEACDGGPRKISVSTRLDRAVGIVYLEVADTGCGIRPEDRTRLFEPYFSTKRSGSGLGLAIVSRIVSDHSGYIRVRENKPRGSRFIIELPART